MKNIIKTVLFITNLFLVIQANAQQNTSVITADSDQKISLNATEQKRLLKKLYYKNGALKEVKYVIGTTLDGTWKHFHTNGQVHKEGGFTNGKEHGVWKTYSETGKLTRLEHYENGVEQGEWKAYHTDGTIAITGTFVNGQRQGKWNVYTTDGLLEKIVTFQNDMDTHIAYVTDHQIKTPQTSIGTIE